MERYSWMIILSAIGILSFIAFFYFILKDMKKIHALDLPQKNYVLNYSLLTVVVICLVLAVYLFFDVQKQIQLLEKMM